MSRTTERLYGLLASTAIVALAGVALGQEQQGTDTTTKTVPVEQPAAQEQPAGETTGEQAAAGQDPAQPAEAQPAEEMTAEQPSAEGEATEEMAEEPAAAEDEATEQLAEEPAAAEEATEEMAEEPAAAEGEAEEQVAEDAPAPPEGPFIDAQEEGELLASELLGLTVVDAEGNDIGDIEDLILHPEGGIFGATVSVGGFLGMGGKDVALSWDQFQYSTEEQLARIDMTRQQLEEAPDFRSLEDVRAEEEALAQQQMQPQGGVPATGAMPEPAAGGTQ